MSKAPTKYRLTAKAQNIKNYHQYRDVINKHGEVLVAFDEICLEGFPMVAKLTMMTEFMALTLMAAKGPLNVREISSWLHRIASYVDQFKEECDLHNWLLLVDKKLTKSVLDYETFRADKDFREMVDRHTAAIPKEGKLPKASIEEWINMVDGPLPTELGPGLEMAARPKRREVESELERARSNVN